MKGLILCGGKGTRMKPLTHTGPKQLIPIANKPIVFYCIEDLIEAGIKDIGVVVGYTAERIELIKDAIGDGSRWNAKITYIRQKAPSGIGDAVMCARNFIGNERFAVYLGDNLVGEGIKEYVDKFKKLDIDAGVLVAEVKDAYKYGVVVLDKDENVVELEEKPKKPKSNLVLIGVYFFNPAIFEALEKISPSWRGEYELTEAINVLVKSSIRRVNAYLVKNWWDDTGTPEDVLHANQMILTRLTTKIEGSLAEDVKIAGQIEIGRGTIVREKCVIRGPVIIGRDCEIGPNTYLGPYTSVGNSVKIVRGAVEYSIIMDRTKIETDTRITNSLIGAETVIAMNQNQPNGSRFIVGENTRIIL